MMCQKETGPFLMRLSGKKNHGQFSNGLSCTKHSYLDLRVSVSSFVNTTETHVRRTHFVQIRRKTRSKTRMKTATEPRIGFKQSHFQSYHVQYLKIQYKAIFENIFFYPKRAYTPWLRINQTV